VHRADAEDLACGTRDLGLHATAQKFAHRGARAQELAGEIDREHLVPLRQGQLVERCVLLQAGVVDQDVDGAELLDHGAEHGAHLRLIRNVGAQGEGAHPLGADLLGEAQRLVFVGDVVDDDIRPRLPERERDRPADAGASAGHERPLAEQQLLRRHARHDGFGQMRVAGWSFHRSIL
jgi:hypothetical protein